MASDERRMRIDAAGAHDGVTVAALMSTPLVTIAPEAQLSEAHGLMRRYGVHHLLVSDRDRIVGIVSDRDIAHRLGPAAARGVANRHEEEAMQRRVLQVAHFTLITVPAAAPVEEAAALIIERGISALPVRDADGAIVGIVTTRDLLRGMLTCLLPAAPTAPGDPPTESEALAG